MIKGIGTDIVEVARIAKSVEKSEFVKRVFSAFEIETCSDKVNANERFAGRFAAKEALLKALGTGWVGGTQFNEIEVRNDELGKPYFQFYGETAHTIEKLGNANIHLSISHTNKSATAFVVIEINSEDL